ncbi:MAG: tetratricopeptide repeat protein, partial [Chloroflexota bacterium]|nr:tetratricopeptide repeat protein [Chloroflexota bacterium]
MEDWDGTLGSLVLGLSTKNQEYLKMRNDPAATVLRAMKLLNLAYTGVHTERLLRSVCAHVFTEKRLLEDEQAWQEAVGLLLQIQFVEEEMDEEDWETILAIRKDAYFEQVVTDYPEPDRPFQLMKHLLGLREVFKDLKDISALFNLSTSFRDREQPKEELITVDEIIALDPRGWMLKGQVLDRLQRHEEAVTAFTRALDIDESDAFVWQRKG